MKSYIHLIRHGITEGNKNRWMYGDTDLPLITEAYLDIEESIYQGRYPEGDGATFYTSGLLRCTQTLNSIYGSVPFVPFSPLREISCGEWECKSFAWLEKNDLRFHSWINAENSDELPMPGGESRVDFIERIHYGFEALKNLHYLDVIKHRNRDDDANSIVVIHGGVITAIMHEYFGDNNKNSFWTWIPKPGRGYTLILEDTQIIGYERI